MARTVLSIAAAPGWAARYLGDEGEKVVTLLAWALVEDGASRTLVGYVQQRDGSVALADELDDFDGYTTGALRTRTV